MVSDDQLSLPPEEIPPPAADDGFELDSELVLELASQPHDAYFKRVFSDPERAAELFRGHLPPALAASLDWEKLTLVPGSFVKSTLQQAHSDLLFTVPDGDRPVLLYLLFEHQTTVDEQMPLRLLSYMVEIWRAEPDDVPLPVIVPFVLHQGPEKWKVSPDFIGMFGGEAALPEEQVPYVPNFRHALLDLSQCEPKDAETAGALRVVLQLMKMARKREMLGFFDWLVRQEFQLVGSFRLLCLLYALHADETLDVKEILRHLEASTELQSTTMTIAQKLINQGLEKGRVEGREAGVWIGKLQMLENLMGLPATDAAVLNGLSAAELEQRFVRLQGEYDGKFKDR